MTTKAKSRTTKAAAAQSPTRRAAAILPGAGHEARTLAFYERDGIIVIDRVADRLGLSKTQLAETMGVKPETFHRAARASAPKTQGKVAEMLEIVARVADWAGGEKQALAWYRAAPLPAFGGRTAESLVKDGKAAALRDWLDHVATGGFA